jgi:hypothetical protein
VRVARRLERKIMHGRRAGWGKSAGNAYDRIRRLSGCKIAIVPCWMHRSNGPGDISVEVGEGRGESDNTSLYGFPCAATPHTYLQLVSYILH